MADQPHTEEAQTDQCEEFIADVQRLRSDARRVEANVSAEHLRWLWRGKAIAYETVLPGLCALATEHQQALAARDAEIAKLRADQQDWRKGVAFIASALRDDGSNLSCVRLGELALTRLAKLEVAEADLAALRAEHEQLRQRSDEGWRRASVNGNAAFDERVRADQAEAEVARLRAALEITRNTVGDLRRGFASHVEPSRWVEQLQAHIDEALSTPAASPAQTKET